MKHFILTLFVGAACIFLLSFSALAETVYITDEIKITVRTGPSNEHKILAVIESGEKVEVLEAGKQWSHIRLADGREGWVVARYLAAEETDRIKLKKLEVEYNNLKDQFASLTEENARLKSENQNLASQLGDSNASLNQWRNDYENLKAGATDFLSLNSKYNQISTQLSKQTKAVEILEKQLASLELHYYLKWVFVGSGVLLAGLILGVIAKRPQRRSSLK